MSAGPSARRVPADVLLSQAASTPATVHVGERAHELADRVRAIPAEQMFASLTRNQDGPPARSAGLQTGIARERETRADGAGVLRRASVLPRRGHAGHALPDGNCHPDYDGRGCGIVRMRHVPGDALDRARGGGRGRRGGLLRSLRRGMATRRRMGEEVLGLPVPRRSHRDSGPHRGGADSASRLRIGTADEEPVPRPVLKAAACERAARLRGR